MKKISILGSTGSVGINALSIMEQYPHLFKVEALACHSRIDILEKQIQKYSPKYVAVFDPYKAAILQKRISQKVFVGTEGLCALGALESVDFVLSAISGFAGLLPTLSAIEQGKSIGLANKEVLVAAGEYVKKLLLSTGARLIPVDSEHSAIFQCLRGQDARDVSSLILTASGGPFWKYEKEKLQTVSLEDALQHPTYKMGKKISVDSSTLMNKGLEVIEAHYLFDVPVEKISVVIHPQSYVHSFVEFEDRSLLAQISQPDMRFPILYALTYPRHEKSLLPKMDFSLSPTFSFFPVDFQKFPCLSLAYEALKIKKSVPCFLNAANEVLVERFLRKEISWSEIGDKLAKLISSHIPENMLDLEAIVQTDKMARIKAKEI